MNIQNKTGNEILEKMVKRVFSECGIEPKGTVVINDYDSRRTYMDIDGKEYAVRTWNIYETSSHKSLVVEWTLYYYKDGESCGTSLGDGINRFRV